MPVRQKIRMKISRDFIFFVYSFSVMSRVIMKMLKSEINFGFMTQHMSFIFK